MHHKINKTTQKPTNDNNKFQKNHLKTSNDISTVNSQKQEKSSIKNSKSYHIGYGQFLSRKYAEEVILFDVDLLKIK